MRRLLFAILPLLFLPLGCSRAAKPAAKEPPNKRVLVVINENNAASREVGEYYALKRKIPARFIFRTKIDNRFGETFDRKAFDDFKSDLKSYLTKKGIRNKIDYIVLTKGVPLRVSEKDTRFSTDSLLTVMWNDKIKLRSTNPYFGAVGTFNSTDYGMYLVTRLDGYTAADAKRLVDRSLRAKPYKGLFLFDADASHNGNPGYSFLNEGQLQAIKLLRQKGMMCRMVTKEFPEPEKDLMGYYTWGSNHPRFDRKKYEGNTFRDGAIAETIVSTSARAFTHVKGGQSLIADLVKAGVTGVKGYVNEPYAISVAQSQVLFDKYTSGYNLAESFYAASPFVHWMDIVIGDPLCAPYAEGKKGS